MFAGTIVFPTLIEESFEALCPEDLEEDKIKLLDDTFYSFFSYSPSDCGPPPPPDNKDSDSPKNSKHGEL